MLQNGRKKKPILNKSRVCFLKHTCRLLADGHLMVMDTNLI